MITEKERDEFEREFGHKPLFEIVVPSRVNLIGEHSDYYEAFVLPMAISNVTMRALVRPRNDQKIRLISDNITNKKEAKIEISTMADRNKLQWIQYIQGAIAMYAEEYTRKALKGFDILIKSSIPVGGGLSSSSALTMTALAALGLSNGFTDGGKTIPLKESIKLINEKKHDGKTIKLLKKLCMMGCWSEYWYGTRGGAMDHFAVTVSKKGSALLLDNRSFIYKHVEMPTDLSVIVCNTMVRHNQLYSGFKDRKDAAMSGFEKIKQYFDGTSNLRDISLEQLDEMRGILEKIEYHRMKHPITEKMRVFQFIESIKDNDYKKLGKIIEEAFLSLHDDYEVSCEELDIMQEAAASSVGCHGARITGGGFGGCIVAFVDKDKKSSFMTEVKKKYDNNSFIKKEKIKSDIWEAYSGDGLQIIEQ